MIIYPCVSLVRPQSQINPNIPIVNAKKGLSMATIKDTLHTVVSDHKNEIYKKFHVEYLALFGSVAKGTARPDSDVDILVKYKHTPGFFDFLNLKKYLEDILGKRVDLVTEGALKKQLLERIKKEAIRVT